MTETRVRFAPSPTGFFHIGSARTALFNWLYARHTGGTFILRIEDTDHERNRPEYLDIIYNSMRWLGMDWDEGPEVGGPYGPYFQSQRNDIYARYLQQLKDAGRTYEQDGAIFFRLEGERYTEYDEYLKAEVEKVKAAPVEIDDAIRGKVVRAETRDFVICRADGSPTFHFVNVVDDIEMKITHVVRGEDHLSNTSKHIEIFNAFGAPVPQYAHLPLILKDPQDGKGKMSKRDRGALIEEYQQRHFLPAAVRNFLALLGWSPKDDREKLDIAEIIEKFELKDIQKGAARFDEKKMAHLNQEYLKTLPVETYAWQARPVLTEAGLLAEDADEDYLQRVLALCQEKVDALENLPSFTRYFFSEEYTEDEKGREKLLKKGDPKARLQEVHAALAKLSDEQWEDSNIAEAFQQLALAHQQDKPFGWWPITRFALSGTTSGPDFIPMIAVLGRDRVLARLERFTAGL
ncbi:MAG: glutamate--tRNA ligase family protein [Verrucomicrobiota bacterium JB022]|nr:glutamate--tRNA ligase family protein [Verrucomicrobiota bacterium JB022]